MFTSVKISENLTVNTPTETWCWKIKKFLSIHLRIYHFYAKKWKDLINRVMIFCPNTNQYPESWKSIYCENLCDIFIILLSNILQFFNRIFFCYRRFLRKPNVSEASEQFGKLLIPVLFIEKKMLVQFFFSQISQKIENLRRTSIWGNVSFSNCEMWTKYWKC